MRYAASYNLLRITISFLIEQIKFITNIQVRRGRQRFKIAGAIVSYHLENSVVSTSSTVYVLFLLPENTAFS